LLIRPPQDKEFEACKASAAGSLAFRPHSRSELAAKLLDKGYDKATIERALSRLQELVGGFHFLFDSDCGGISYQGFFATYIFRQLTAITI
jgi:hypothetical protein